MHSVTREFPKIPFYRVKFIMLEPLQIHEGFSCCRVVNAFAMFYFTSTCTLLRFLSFADTIALCNNTAQLKDLRTLKEYSILTKEQFEEQRNKILKEMSNIKRKSDLQI